MIKVEKGLISFKGRADEVEADFRMIVMGMYEKFQKQYTEEKAEKKLLEMTKEGIEFQKAAEKGELEELMAKKLHAKIDEMFHLLKEAEKNADR